MNYRMILKIIGRVVGIEGALLLIPTAVALYFKESPKGFLVSIAACAAFFGLSVLISKNCDTRIYAKEGFTSVALSWVVMAAVGAIPFVIEAAIPNYINAFFETISGFTTTGASIINDIEILPKGILFWRSFTHWIGGMGILVFMMAVVPMSEEYSMYIMRAEVPGPEAGKLTAKVQHTSIILYLIYIFITLAETVALKICGLPLYDSVVHAMGTAGTGGFSSKNASIGAYGMPSVEIVIAVFMMLFGVNFNIYFFMILKKFRAVVRNEELRVYLFVVAFATVTIAFNIRHLYDNSMATALRYSFFQVNSFASTTGYTTAAYEMWPQYSKTFLTLLMFFGACAGSTAGGMKVSRLIILVRSAKVELKHLLHPRSFNPVAIEKKAVSKETLRSTLVFFEIEMFALALGTLLISLEKDIDFTASMTSVASCLANVGPYFGFGKFSGNFANFSYPSKLLLSVFMLMGRLELYPVVILLYPSTWKKKGQF